MYLNCHSWFSFKYGVLKPEALLEEAAKAGVRTLALTDIHCSAGIPDLLRNAADHGVRPVAGIEFRQGARLLYIGIARNNDGFQQLVKDLSMQIAASAPLYVRREEVPAEIVQLELELAKKQLREQKKPEAMLEKIAAGKLDKYFSDIVLMEQPFIKDDKKKVGEVVTDAIAKIGENIQVRRFTRYALGEGLEKKVENYAEEVAKAAGAVK